MSRCHGCSRGWISYERDADFSPSVLMSRSYQSSTHCTHGRRSLPIGTEWLEWKRLNSKIENIQTFRSPHLTASDIRPFRFWVEIQEYRVGRINFEVNVHWANIDELVSLCQYVPPRSFQEPGTTVWSRNGRSVLARNVQSGSNSI